jgi:hypothetical protein
MSFPHIQSPQFAQYGAPFQQHPAGYANQMADSGHYHGPPQMEYPAVNPYGTNHFGPQGPAQPDWEHYHRGMQDQYEPNRNGVNPSQYPPSQYPASNQGWPGAGGFQAHGAMPAQNMPSYDHPQFDHSQQNFVPQPLHNSSRHASWNENGNGYANGYANGYGESSYAQADGDVRSNCYGAAQAQPNGQLHVVHFAHQPMKPSKRGQRHTGKQVSPKSVRSEAAQGR